MKTKTNTFVVAACALAFALPSALVFGDFWRLPTPKIFLSSSGTVAVRIIPRDVDSQLEYFADLSAGQESPGLPPGASRPRPRAEVYRDNGYGSLSLETSFDLVNEVSPVSALVSDDGRFLVTFDNWHSIGRGEHVVVIYRSDGSLVRDMALADFLTKQDIRGLMRSTSSIYWSGQHFIDPDTDTLVLLIAACAQGEPDCDDRFAEVKIDLPTGTPLQPTRDLLPHWEGRVTLLTEESPPDPENQDSFRGVSCDPGWTVQSFEEAQPVSLRDLLALGEYSPLPVYTEIALRAKIQGQVSTEILVSPEGNVVCVRHRRPLPMGLTEVAHSTLLGWQLKEAAEDSHLRKAPVNLMYELVLVPPTSE